MRRVGRGRDRPEKTPLTQDRDLDRILHDALHAAADSIEPAGDGLERIRRRLSEPWLTRQLSLMRAGDWLRLGLAMASAVTIALTGAAAVGQIGHSDGRIGLSTVLGASTRAPASTGPVRDGYGQSSVLNSAQPGSAGVNPAQPEPVRTDSARAKPARPGVTPRRAGRKSHRPSAATANCPPSPAITASGTPTPTPTPDPSPATTPSPAPSSTPSQGPPSAPATASSGSPQVSGPPVATSGSGTPASGSSRQPCDDGRGRR